MFPQEKYNLWGLSFSEGMKEKFVKIGLGREIKDVCSCSKNKLHNRLNWEFIVTILGKVCSIIFGY